MFADCITAKLLPKHDGFNPTVFGILRNFPYLEKGQSLADINTLEQLVLLYGRPQKTSWTFFRTTRYLVWAQDGIATMVDADIRYRSWDKFLVGNVLIFESMSLDQFLQTQWPYKGWEDHNLYIDGDAPDTLPEDPYDWEHMPTPIQ